MMIKDEFSGMDINLIKEKDNKFMNYFYENK